MHSGRPESSQTLTKTHAARPRFERLKHEALFCILLYRIARHPAAWVNIVLCVRVPRVCRMLRADDWYDTQNICDSEHTETHTAQSVTCEVQMEAVGECCQLWSSIWSAVVCITFAVQCQFLQCSLTGNEGLSYSTLPSPLTTQSFLSLLELHVSVHFYYLTNLFTIRICATLNPSDKCFLSKRSNSVIKYPIWLILMYDSLFVDIKSGMLLLYLFGSSYKSSLGQFNSKTKNMKYLLVYSKVCNSWQLYIPNAYSIQ